MPIKGGETQLKEAELMFSLPLASRTSVINRTITAAAAAAIGATSIQLTASAATQQLRAGTALSFVAPTAPTKRQSLVIVDDVTLSATAVAANIFELDEAISANSTAPWVEGLLPLLGIQNFSMASQDQEVDTTNTLSGFGTEMALVRSGKTLSVSGIQIPADDCLERVIKPVTIRGAFFGKEVFAKLSLPDGEEFSGVAKIRNFSSEGNQNEVKRYSFELTFMGSTFNQLQAYFFT